MSRFWKISFYGLLGFYLLSMGIQLYEYLNASTITLDATWNQAKIILGWMTLFFVVLNAIIYKLEIYGTSKNQIANGFFACSVLTILYYSVSHLLMPYIYFVQLGRLDLFLN